MDNIKSNTNSYLSFKLGNEIFATDVRSTIKILQLPEITKVPESPEKMAGLINHHGNVLPVYDLNKSMDLKDNDYDKNTCVIILSNKNNNNIGLIVNEVLSVEEVKNEDIKPSPQIGDDSKLENIAGIFQKNDNFIMILDVNDIFKQIKSEY
jgi:purine-binding chemotaxis protein CheW